MFSCLYVDLEVISARVRAFDLYYPHLPLCAFLVFPRVWIQNLIVAVLHCSWNCFTQSNQPQHESREDWALPQSNFTWVMTHLHLFLFLRSKTHLVAYPVLFSLPSFISLLWGNFFYLHMKPYHHAVEDASVVVQSMFVFMNVQRLWRELAFVVR